MVLKRQIKKRPTIRKRSTIKKLCSRRGCRGCVYTKTRTTLCYPHWNQRQQPARKLSTTRRSRKAKQRGGGLLSMFSRAPKIPPNYKPGRGLLMPQQFRPPLQQQGLIRNVRAAPGSRPVTMSYQPEQPQFIPPPSFQGGPAPGPMFNPQAYANVDKQFAEQLAKQRRNRRNIAQQQLDMERKRAQAIESQAQQIAKEREKAYKEEMAYYKDQERLRQRTIAAKQKLDQALQQTM